ncbi:unnamed protein product [Somion occarium]|uniref:Integrase zinc-binding domain-containing protein n=1 Tax=Somion occarium TaxID=3059160 RepID=A0ABP1CPY6_9APHY
MARMSETQNVSYEPAVHHDENDPVRSKQTQLWNNAAKDSSVPPLPNGGLPSLAVCQRLEEEYISSLSVRKRDKALLSQEMFDDIWDVLHDPRGSHLTSQFRYWVRKMFTLATIDDGDKADEDVKPVILHENRPVAVRTQIYDILCYCHQLCGHGGRDRTTATVRAHFSWIPKEVVARFVKACPTCTLKKAGCWGIIPKGKNEEAQSSELYNPELLTMDIPETLEWTVPQPLSGSKAGSKKRIAWNKQPPVNKDVPLSSIQTRFPQPLPTLPHLAHLGTSKPLQIQAGTSLSTVANHSHGYSSWLSDLVGLPNPASATHDRNYMRRTASSNDASFPRARGPGPSMPTLSKSYSEGSPANGRDAYTLRPIVQRPLPRSPSSVLSDGDSTDAGDYGELANAKAWPPIDPILLAEENNVRNANGGFGLRFVTSAIPANEQYTSHVRGDR